MKIYPTNIFWQQIRVEIELGPLPPPPGELRSPVAGISYQIFVIWQLNWCTIHHSMSTLREILGGSTRLGTYLTVSILKLCNASSRVSPLTIISLITL